MARRAGEGSRLCLRWLGHGCLARARLGHDLARSGPGHSHVHVELALTWTRLGQIQATSSLRPHLTWHSPGRVKFQALVDLVSTCLAKYRPRQALPTWSGTVLAKSNSSPGRLGFDSGLTWPSRAKNEQSRLGLEPDLAEIAKSGWM